MTARVFMSYSHEDEVLRDQLECQLSILKHQGLIEVWHDRRLIPGDNIDFAISKELDNADIILMLLSPDFLNSDYCYGIEAERALQRQQEGSARLISVILRPCDWKHTELSKSLVTPKDGKPITRWPDRDEALLDVSDSIRKSIEKLGLVRRSNLDFDHIRDVQQVETMHLPRSSNLRIQKIFTEAEADKFLLESFEFMKLFFRGSLSELENRNSDIETRFRSIDANSFSAAIYRNGVKETSCVIRLDGLSGNDGITYVQGDDVNFGGWNELITVEHDEQKLFMQPMGMPYHSFVKSDSVLSHEGAAEYFWALLIQPIQGNQHYQ